MCERMNLNSSDTRLNLVVHRRKSFYSGTLTCDLLALFVTNTWVIRFTGSTGLISNSTFDCLYTAFYSQVRSTHFYYHSRANNVTETYPSETVVCLDNLLSLAFFCERFFDLRLVGSGAVVSICTNTLTPKPLISSK